MLDFQDLIKDVSSWSTLETRIGELPSEGDRGEAFELFCKAFFILDPLFQFHKVYRHKEIPSSVRERLGYPTIQDIGIDGIAVTSDNKLFAYQAKFRKDRDRTPSLRELSTFFTVSDRADWRITITNANNLPTSINDRTRQSRILADRFDQLDSDFFNRLRVYFAEQTVRPQKRLTAHRTQQEAIEKALVHFQHSQRGQLILPCGTGKTLAAMWIAEKFGGNRILVMVPSLSLLSQTLREWAINTTLRPFRYLCLCSDTTVDLGEDSPIEHMYEMEVPVTTDVDEVSAFLVDKPSIPSVLFSTYQSSKVLNESVINTRTTFDIGIFDEAHRTTGSDVTLWSIALDDQKVPIHKRLFMTATPRIFAPHITKKAKENDVMLCSMDDAAIYGKPFYEMKFGEAIKRGHITDFKVIVIFTTDAEVKKTIQKSGRIVTDDAEWDAKAFAKRIALSKGLNAYGLKKIFTFHGSVKGAKSFTDQASPYGFNKLIKIMSLENQNINSIKYFHVNGTMPAGQRSGLMKEFREANTGIMSNARCLNEGIDVPAVDTVAFIDPKRSLIDIVQATGRALRKADWKGRGYIFIPVVVDEVSDPEQLIKNSDFETVWKVIQAMVDQDQRLESIISKLRVMQGEGETESQEWKDAMTEFRDKIDFYDLPIKYDKARFINNLYAKILEVVSRSWDFWYGLTLKYKKETDDPNALQIYKTPDGYRLGEWQNTQRQDYKKGDLSIDRVNKLEGIGFKWKIADFIKMKLDWDFCYELTLKYKKENNNPNAPQHYKTPEGYRLGQWQSTQRKNCKKGILSIDRVKKLEDIGFKWKLTDFQYNRRDWDFWYGVTIKYKQEAGDPNAPWDYQTPDGYRLNQWQSHQRRNYKKGNLSTDKVKRLEEIGFVVDPYDDAFEKGFQETLEFKKHTGHPNAPQSYKNPEGYKLGQWQSNQRRYYLKKNLLKDRVKRLKEIGFKWKLTDFQYKRQEWDIWYGLTLKYKQETGDPNAPTKYQTPDGYRLGSWQSHQRENYLKENLTRDRVKRLEEIGFKWPSR